jgi:hypothetical protein
MNLEVVSIWSPDLINQDSPQNINEFDVFLQISLKEKGGKGSEVFACRVCSPSMLAETISGSFIKSTLCLSEFNWDEIRKRIEKVIIHTGSCQTWDCVIKKLTGYLDYADQENS